MRIGVITEYIENEYFTKILKSIYETLTENNAQMIVLCTYRINRDKFYLFSADHIDGWIILFSHTHSDYFDIIAATGKPVVIIADDCSLKEVSCVYSNNKIGTEKVVEHLIWHGHRDIAFFGYLDVHDFIERYRGYKTALEKNNIPFREDLVYKMDVCIRKDAYLQGLKMVEEGIKFSAIVAANDWIALGLMDAFLEKGYKIPEEIAVFGFDDIKSTIDINPHLSSVRQDLWQMGQTSVKIILNKINQKDLNGEICYVDNNLIFRGSCGCEDEISTSNNDEVDRLTDMINADKRDSIVFNLMKASMGQIKESIISINKDRRTQCIGMWEQKNLETQFFMDSTNLSQYSQVVVTPEEFPTTFFLNNIRDDEIVWIHHISSDQIHMGALCYTGKVNKESVAIHSLCHSLFIYEMLATAIDREINFQTLTKAKTQLVQTENMVSLGKLVAGITHEMNTPIGVGVTAASFLEQRTQDFKESIDNGTLKKSDLYKYVDLCDETSKILASNLKRASELILSFKQVSADQSSAQKRNFYLKNYIDQMLLTLSPNLKKTRHKVLISCEENIEINSYPGVFSQILTNLVMNSLIHGFDEGFEGLITINVVKENDTKILITYSDNGKGIEKEHLNKIYEPFFTTKRDNGGTGLGLNIIYNIVTQTLGGTIKCESQIGKGTTFLLEFPVT